MSLATAHMTITAADIERDLVEVLAASDRLLGFYRLRRRESRAWLEDLFIDPAVVRAGHGRRLFQRACAVAREWGYATMEMVADPHAEVFYLRLGATRVGTVPSEVFPGRRLPLLRLSLWRYEPAESSVTKPSMTTRLPDDAGSLVPVGSTETMRGLPGARSAT